MTTPVLAVRDLGLSYRRRGRWLPALRDVSLSVAPGEAMGLVGESGCGKSTLAMAALGYLPRNARIDGGSIAVEGRDLAALSAEALRALRGPVVAAVYQNPGAALNPSLTVGEQVAEVYRTHAGMARAAARGASAEMLERVRLPAPARQWSRYPHELSGGMQQRIIIAMALAADPSLLILDEPTTALDATVQAEILDLFLALRREFRASLLFISHDLAVVQSVCDRVGVMYAGELMERASASAVFRRPRHPYTASLIDCIPDLGTRKADLRLTAIPGSPPRLGAQVSGCVFAPRCPVARPECRRRPVPLIASGPDHDSRCLFPEDTAAPGGNREPRRASLPPPGPTVLEVRGLHVTLGGVRILENVDLDIGEGETVALVGESGSGKTTLARALLGLTPPDSGMLDLENNRLRRHSALRSQAVRQRLQMVFQSPDGTLNPSHRVGRALARAVRRLSGAGRAAASERARTLLEQVSLEADVGRRYPGQLSGGQRQRAAIARAFAGTPRLVVLDETTSALDVSVQASILDLLLDLQVRQRVAYLFISHDLGVVRYIADRVAVLYLGEIVESGPVDAVFGGARHPYTDALVSAVPRPDGRHSFHAGTSGRNPGPANRPPGCPYHTRCPYAMAQCRAEPPPQRPLSPGHVVRCHLAPERMPGAAAVEPDRLVTPAR